VTSIALAAAMLGAVGYGAASVLQGVAAMHATGPAVLRQPVYLVGLLCDCLAWLASLVALRVLPLFVVQSVLAGSVMVTVVLARLFLHTRLRGRDLGAIAAIVPALAALAHAFMPGPAAIPAGMTAWTLLAMVAVVIAVAAAYARAGSVLLAALAGAAFSGAAVGARAVDLPSGPLLLPGQPLAWAVLVFGAAGTLAYARSLERGPVGPATAVLWSAETLLAGAVGVLVLGDTVRPGWSTVATVAVVVTLLGCAVLAGAPAEKAIDPVQS
jgi:hypothetical protein